MDGVSFLVASTSLEVCQRHRGVPLRHNLRRRRHERLESWTVHGGNHKARTLAAQTNFVDPMIWIHLGTMRRGCIDISMPRGVRSEISIPGGLVLAVVGCKTRFGVSGGWCKWWFGVNGEWLE